MDRTGAAVREEAILFGQTRSLVGILTDPPESVKNTNLPGMILLNAGIVHRVGPQRLYVKIARSLAELGFVVLRFDFSGIGDSKVRPDNLPFERSAVSEAQDAMNHLGSARGIDRFVLLGLCSGADMSLKAAWHDPRVVGAVLINPQGDQQDAANELNAFAVDRKISRYYWQTALRNPKSWLRAVRGEANYAAIVRALVFQLRYRYARLKRASSGMSRDPANFRSLAARGVRLLLVFSKGDAGLDYFREVYGEELRHLCSGGTMDLHVVPRSTHTFTFLRDQGRLLGLVRDWAQSVTARGLEVVREAT